MKLIEALAHLSSNPITVINRPDQGRQFRWCNGHIQTKPPKSKYWHRIQCIRTYLLEYAEIDDNELL